MTTLELNAGNVKAAMRDAGASSSDLWKVPPSQIHIIEGFNARLLDADYIVQVRRLANSMKEEGFYPDKPLTGYVGSKDGTDVIYLTDGHRRLEAALLAISEGAELEKLPIVISAKGTSLADLTVALVKSNTGQPLKPYEVAIVCKRLSRFGWDTKQIASRLDFSTQYVDDLLLFMGAPEGLHELVKSGKMALTLAITLCVKYGAGVLEYLEECKISAGTDKITAKNLPGAAVKAYAKKHAAHAFGALRLVKADPGYASLGAGLRAKLDLLLTEAEKAGRK